MQQLAPGQRVEATPEQLIKLRNDLTVVQDNMRLFSNLLDHVEDSERVQDSELLPELAVTCAAMQERVTELLLHVTNEDLITSLLEVNDQLNAVLAAYRTRLARDPGAVGSDRTSSQDTVFADTAQRGAQPAAVDSRPRQAASDLLVDVDADPMTSSMRHAPRPLLAQAATQQLTQESSTDDMEFDMFSQVRRAV